jgi:hypothetical protein
VPDSREEELVVREKQLVKR